MGMGNAPTPPPGYPSGYPPGGYGAAPVQPPRRGRGVLTTVLAALGGVLVACCACALVANLLAGKGGTTTRGSGGASPTTATAPATVGDTITVNHVACTLLSVRAISGDRFIQPRPGNQFIVVRVTLINEAGNEIAYHQGDFHVKDGQGNITDNAFPPFTYTANDQLHDGTLAASGTVSGDIIFQVPTGDHAAELTWQPNFFGAKAANVWLLGL
jgi:Domain of unknown function (DUF4352)